MFSVHSAVLWGNESIEDPGTRKSGGQWLEQAPTDTGSVLSTSAHSSLPPRRKSWVLLSLGTPGCVMLSSYELLGCQGSP